MVVWCRARGLGAFISRFPWLYGELAFISRFPWLYGLELEDLGPSFQGFSGSMV